MFAPRLIRKSIIKFGLIKASAAQKLNLPDLTISGYNLKNDASGINKIGDYWAAGSLLDILKNEQSFN